MGLRAVPNNPPEPVFESDAELERWAPQNDDLPPPPCAESAESAVTPPPSDLSAHNALSAHPRKAEWPVLAPAAHHGLAGQIVAALEPTTEADPAGLLVHLLVSFGSVVGSGPHATADGSPHPGRLFAAFVGNTSRGRKSTITRRVHTLFAAVEPEWHDTRVMGGLASGEGLIAAVADNEDGGSTDGRILVTEPELARVLAACAREGSTLSAVLREAWDSDRLRVMTRKEPLVATGCHVSIAAHITTDEIRRRTTESDANNGLLNRWLFVAVKRSKLLPDGGDIEAGTHAALVDHLRAAIQQARRIGAVTRSPAAAQRWATIYGDLAEDDPGGLVGAVTARAEAQVLRLSVVYALLDSSRTIEPVHLDAALAVWNYSAASAAWIFGDSLGDDVADRLLSALRSAGPDGLTATEQRDVFGRHVSSARVTDARRLLEERKLAVTTTIDTAGRPRTVTTVAQEATEAQKGSRR